MRVDLHNHTTLCNHATGTKEEYVKEAIKQKIDIFGFSCHAPMDFEKEYRMSLAQSKIYEQEILNLKEKYKNDIKILLAYEVDFMLNSTYMEKDILKANVDYLIGSVHFLDGWGFDNPQYIGNFHTKNIDKIWEDYFATISLLAKSGHFDIIGHLDLIKIFNYLPKKDIIQIAKKTMKDIKKANIAIEINSAGFRKPIKEQYPSKELLQLAFELDIPITFGSDAHTISQVGDGYEKAKQIALDIGYTTCLTFEKRDKQSIKI
jgi:histidinol-phosphatase (PHP family)